MYASYWGHTAAVQALMGAVADLNLQDKVSGVLMLIDLRQVLWCGCCQICHFQGTV
jgi:hypothetical protein